MEQREVYYTGRVQGVGFRYTTQSVASRIEVTGYVKNLRDGRVQLVAEGTPKELDAFLNAVDEAMAGHITDRDTTVRNASGEFAEFGVRF